MHTTSSIGGVETWLDRATADFSRHGIDAVVGLVRGQRFNRPERYKADHPGLQTIEVDGRGLNREGRVRALVRSIAKVKPDIVIPLGIVDANEAAIRRKQQAGGVRLLARAQGNLEPMLADLAMYRDWVDGVVCPGRLTRNVLVEWAGYPADRVRNIPNGADLPMVPRVAREPGTPIRLAYVGRMSQADKRPLDLIPLCRELMERGVDFHLDVVGDGACRSQLESELAPWQERITFHGALPHEAVYSRIFPAIDVLLMLSSSEAFGIVLVEAMMHGVVPVSSRYHGFHSEGLVVDDVTGVSFDVGDMRMAASHVQRLASDEASLSRLGENAQAHGRTYTWQNSLGQWRAAIEELSQQPVLLGDGYPAPPGVSPQGRLEGWGVPPGVTDSLRRMRRALLGPATQAGGEEWPLFNRSHPARILAEVRNEMERIEGEQRQRRIGVPDGGAVLETRG